MSGQWHGGKGSSPRKMSVSHEEWESRWDAIFARDLPKDKPAAENQKEEQSNTAPESTKE